MKETIHVMELREGTGYRSAYDREVEREHQAPLRSRRRPRQRPTLLTPAAHIAGWAAFIILLLSLIHI